MGTATEPAGQLVIGGSKGGTGAKGEAAFAPMPAESAAVPPPPADSERPGRSKRGPEPRGGAGRLSSGSCGVFTKTQTRLNFSGFILTYTTLDTSGAGSARWTERDGSPQGLSTPSPTRNVPKTRNCARDVA